MRLFLCPLGACGAWHSPNRNVPKPISENTCTFATDFEIENKKQ